MVYYSRHLPSGHDFYGIVRVMLRWKGSIYKIIWKDVCVYLVLFFILSFSYRFGMDDSSRRKFEDIVQYISKWSQTVPTTFVLGFFVTQVLSRWWKMFGIVPWMNRTSFTVQAMVSTGKDPTDCRKLCTTAMRYLNLSWILAFKQISESVRKRTNRLAEKLRKEKIEQKKKECTAEHNHKEHNELDFSEELEVELESLNNDPKVKLFFGQLITPTEIETFKLIARQLEDSKYKAEQDYWLPLQWSIRLFKKAMKQGYIESERNYLQIVESVNNFRGQLASFLIYADTNVPLVYTQVVIIAVYTYFFAHILDRQFLQIPQADEKDDKVRVKQFDYYFPIIAIFELVFVVGWLRVAMILINPLGVDDEDFPMNMIFDYNMMISVRSAGDYDYQYPRKLQDSYRGLTSENIEETQTWNSTIDSDDEITNYHKNSLHFQSQNSNLNSKPETEVAESRNFLPDHLVILDSTTDDVNYHDKDADRVPLTAKSESVGEFEAFNMADIDSTL